MAKPSLRKEAKRLIVHLPQDCQDRFKMMYGSEGGKLTKEVALAKDVLGIIDNIPSRYMKRVLDQIASTFTSRKIPMPEAPTKSPPRALRIKPVRQPAGPIRHKRDIE